MKVPTKKLMIIITAIICLIGGIALIPAKQCREWHSFMLSIFEKPEETRVRKIIEAMSCRPEKPLSKGERYAIAMQEYWIRILDGKFTLDERLAKNLDNLPPNSTITVNREMCGIEETDFLIKNKVMTTDNCYPFKLENYPTRESIMKKQPVFDIHIDKKVTQEFNGKKYNPKQGFLQQPQHYNQPSGFGVLQASNWSVWFYSEDCCQLKTYKQLIDFIDLEGKSWIRDYFLPQISEDIKVQSDYLLIKHSTLPSNIQEKKEDGSFKNFKAYLVSPCGKLVDF